MEMASERPDIFILLYNEAAEKYWLLKGDNLTQVMEVFFCYQTNSDICETEEEENLLNEVNHNGLIA